MTIPTQLKYTNSHEWVKQGDDGLLWVGITDAAQDMLGDLVFVGDFKVGESLKAGDTVGVVESVKAASDVYAPVEGEVVAFNESLSDEPQQLNTQPYEAWIFKLKTSQSTEGLLDAAGYQAVLNSK
ncbi:MAG: glycine cleavage system protein GcvH [Burkholderiales bacterium]|jgi:glycine cleavage system H protein|nr:glycine cleavage system protein GcvH [Burkholderiales bacterium]MCA3154959.1 glycine cleavage system protein GcvH [Burkholderiales bacterium]MCA3155960.1 glycine cleavage system protein GcvH [Burkholderiales bacterium]MCA3159092.1 glycine cleavage system protein GcvH [Burkholderiales bacterium]MCA3161874.1 glycine cleavage system protein GcvH [Burkholderiales bacterium]